MRFILLLIFLIKNIFLCNYHSNRHKDVLNASYNIHRAFCCCFLRKMGLCITYCSKISKLHWYFINELFRNKTHNTDFKKENTNTVRFLLHNVTYIYIYRYIDFHAEETKAREFKLNLNEKREQTNSTKLDKISLLRQTRFTEKEK